MGHLDARIKAFTTDDSGQDKQEIVNSIIMAWLIISMVPQIGENFHRMKTAKDIWDTVASTYAQKGNYTQELTHSIDRSQQGDTTVTKQFAFLTINWDRVDHFQDY